MLTQTRYFLKHSIIHYQ